LPLDDAKVVQDYLRLAPAEKALALAPGGAYWWDGEGTATEARSRALAYCKERAGADCTLAAENFRLLSQTPPKAAARPSP
jgi:hypothetical protein